MDDELAAKHILLDIELVTFITLVLGGLFYAVLRWLRRDPLAERENEGERFDVFDLFLMLFPALLFLANPLIEVYDATRKGGVREEEVAPLGIVGLLTNIGYFVFVGVMTYGLIEWVRNRRISVLFGLKRLGLGKIILYSIFGGIISLIVCGKFVGEASNEYLKTIFGELEVQEPIKMLQESLSSLHLALSILMACVAAPIVEEFLFRGYMYGTLRQLTHPIFAAVVIGALFAVVHGNLPAFAPLWVFSILLCIAYESSRSLWVPVGIHAVFNAANIILMLIPEAAE